MPAEAPFLFSVAGLSASLAGLAGLVAALRKGEGLRPIDVFRLQEIVEFAFANVLISLSFVAVASSLGVPTTARLAGIGILAYLFGNGVGLGLRLKKLGVEVRRPWMLVAGATSLAGIALGLATAATGSVVGLELLVILLLARPMISFLFVLGSLGSPEN